MPDEATPVSGAEQPSIQDRLHAFLGAEQATPESKKAEVKDSVAAPKVVAIQEQSQPDPVEDADDVDVDSGDQAVDEDVVDPDADATEEIEEKPKTVRELAAKLGMEYEDLLDSIQAETKIDGEEGKVPLSKLIKSYQIEGHLNRKSMDLSDARKAFEQEAQSKQQQFDEGFNQLRSALDANIRSFQGEIASVNWQELENSDPVEFLRLRTRFEDRNRQLLSHHQYIQAEETKKAQTAQQAMTSKYEEEVKQLINNIPEWKDKKAAKAGHAELMDYLKTSGFDDDTINDVKSHKLILALRKAMKYDALQAKKQDVVRKINEAPKLSRPGAQKGGADNENATYLKLRKQHKTTGKVPPGLLSRFAN